MNAPVDPIAVAARVDAIFTQLGVIHTIGGSIAASFAGEPRSTVGDGATLPIHPPEDILVQKLRWYRRGGEVSDRQWRDILGIVRVQDRRLDLSYLRRQAAVLGVTDLLERALAGK